ncbi:hypothetical protein [Parapedomonas caeni]
MWIEPLLLQDIREVVVSRGDAYPPEAIKLDDRDPRNVERHIRYLMRRGELRARLEAGGGSRLLVLGLTAKGYHAAGRVRNSPPPGKLSKAISWLRDTLAATR